MPLENVIVIVSDTLRADHLGAYGCSTVVTPNIDRLASRSMVFDRAYLHNFPTVPARTDIFTGRYTSAYLDWQPLSKDETVLADVLSAAGLTTFLVGDTYNLFRDDYYFTRGFTGFDWVRGNGGDRWQTHPRNPEMPAARERFYDVDNYLVRYLRNAMYRRSEADYAVARTMRRAGEWLRNNHAEGPFFLHVDTFDPHEPWDPPQAYLDMYEHDYSGDNVMFPKYAATSGYLTDSELTHCRALYAASITMMDKHLGSLLDTMDALDLWDNTAILFMGDHGFYLGERGWIGKTRIIGDMTYYLPLYDEVSRVPLIVYAPDVPASRCDALVQLVDVAPTVYDLLRVEQPATVQGQSLVPLLRQDVNGVRDVAWSGQGVQHAGRWRPSTLTTNEWSLIYNGQLMDSASTWASSAVDGFGRREVTPRELGDTSIELGPQLFDLRVDPGQVSNVASQHWDVVKELHQWHISLLKSLGVPHDAIALREMI